MNIKDQIQIALANSLVADAGKLKQSTQYLTQLRNKQGYCINLMEIVDQQNNPLPIKQAALIQLKNTIKLRWKSTKGQIIENDKVLIKNAIITAIIRCSKNSKLVKLYRQVLTIIVGYQYNQWMPIGTIVEKLRKRQDLQSIMHCLVAIAASFQFTVTKQQRNYLFQFLKVILPQLIEVLKNQQSFSFVFLNLKFLWKAVHYDINDQIRVLTINWMPLLLAVISMRNSQYDTIKKTTDFYDKNTPQFYYFHSKKWASRILLRYIQKHAKLSVQKKSTNQIQFATKWYQSYGLKLTQQIYKGLQVPTIPKVRYFQMKCIQALTIQRPDSVRPFAEKLQYQILLPYLSLKKQDQQLANSDPIQFLNRQLQPCMNFTNLKKVATEIWVAISQIGSKSDPQKISYQAGQYFFTNMNYLKEKLQSGNLLEKEMAMYLICQLRGIVVRCQPVKQIMPKLISTYIIPEFRNQVMFLRARAVDIFYQYGSIGFPLEIIQAATEGIYICLTQDRHVLVRIKAASAFNCILRHKAAKQLVRPLLKDILTIYLQLLEQYDLEILVNSLQSVVEDFSTQIEPFAMQLVKYLIKLFHKLFNKDAQQNINDQYGGQIQLAAAGCLKTVTQIIDAPLSLETIHNLQKQIIDLCYFIFTSGASDYVEDLLVLLNSYLYKVRNMSSDLWFFYQVIIYNITGIPEALWTQIQNTSLNSNQKQVLKSVHEGENYEMMEQSMLVLRNYLKKGSLMQMNNADAFKANMVHLLFFLISQIYKRGPGQYTGQLEMKCCTTLLVNYLQNTQTLQTPILINIWQLTKYNILKLKSQDIKLLNSQIIALLIYRSGSQFMSLLINQKMVPVAIRQLLEYQKRLQYDHQYQRLILGLTTLIAIPQRTEELLTNFPKIFKVLLKLLRKSIQCRLEQKQQQNMNHEDSGDQNISNQEKAIDDEQSDQDDDDFFQEMYDENYESLLKRIDQVEYFQNTIKKMQRQSPQFYSQIMQVACMKQLIILQQKIPKAIQKFKNKFKENKN